MGKKIKTCIIGDTSVGKTSILTRIIENSFRLEVPSTVGIDYKFQTKKIHGEQVGVQLWDTSGQDKYRSVAKNFFRNSDGVFVVFSLSDDNSLKGLQFWMEQLKENLDPDVPCILLANKCDLKEQPSVQAKRLIRKFKEEDNCTMFKVSAKTGVNIKQAYEQLVDEAFKYMKKQVNKESFIIQGSRHKKKGCC